MTSTNSGNPARLLKSFLFPVVLTIIAFSCNQSNDGGDNGRPEENRFTTSVLTRAGELDEPMEFTFLNNDRLLFVERKGNLKSLDIKTKEVKKLASIPVNTKYTNKQGETREAEEGLMGIIAHPEYEKNHWIYMFYADPTKPKHVLARWELHGDSLYEATKKIVLEFPTQREVCCHTGGGMVFDKDGNLFLTTGNNTGNPVQGTSALDERPDRANWDDQRTAGNSNDLRGKILRIHPEDDGTYTIPEGNLFPVGTEKTKPEIYTMGHRNAWRISVDNETGYIYWGEVGPDASRDSTIGPRGYDEFNVARKPGFFGWPYFIADNKPYPDYDYATGKIGDYFDVNNVVNNSPNNTGITNLPAPQKAFIWYPYAHSEEFPLVGSAGRSATGGPLFRTSDFPESAKRFPGWFEGKWLIVDFMRGWIMVITMDEEGNYKSMERFLPGENFSSAIDMKFSPDGDLYVLEYGSAWFRGNENAQIKRIEYNGGNRKPIVRVSADKTAGSVPLAISFSSEGTVDYDKDDLKYEWTVKSSNGFSKTISGPNPQLTLEQQGIYTATLTVTDSKNETNSQSLEIKAGNEPPVVDIHILKGNKSFFFPESAISYAIDVNDKEDGGLKDGKIDRKEISVNFDYAPEGFDPIEIAQNHRASDEWTSFSKGANLIGKSDCKSCHMIDKKSVGPSYLDVAAKYHNNKAEQERIAGKIITGGAGVWGDHAMSAHPQISPEDASLMVQYIMSLNKERGSTNTIPLEGTFVTSVPKDDNGKGGYLLRVAYSDKGASAVGSLTSEKIIALRNPVIDPEKAELSKGTQVMITPSRSFNMVGDASYIGFKNIDLTGLQEIEFTGQAQPRVGAIGGVIEVRLDSANGELIGTSDRITPKSVDFRGEIAKANAENAEKAKKSGKPAQPVDMAALRERLSHHVFAGLKPTEGSHDIFFVFRNADAREGQILFQVQDIEFKLKPDAVAKK